MIPLCSEVAGQRHLDDDSYQNERDRLRVHAFVAELEDQAGPVEETEVARNGAMLAAASAAAKAGEGETS